MVRELSFLMGDISDFVARHTGLHFPPEKWTDLQRGLSSAARELGHRDAEQFAGSLLSERDRREIEVLASHLTVGETYFFRETQTLELFAGRILPELLRSRDETGRAIRIWSAGCCTGEEPYTIAMLVDMTVGELDRSDVTILATDINPRFLRKATEAVYGEWSFRSMRADMRQRYFRQRRRGQWELDPRIRRLVKFSYMNLATDPYPSLFTDTNAIDLIFCRNVLMYFSEEAAKQVVERFVRALLPGGWLVVSATEASDALFAPLQPVRFPGGTVYRKSSPQKWHRPPAAPVAAVPIVYDRPAIRSPEPPPQVEPRDFLSIARRCANEGRLEEAAQWCRRAIESDKMNPRPYYLLALIEQEEGHGAEASDALRRAIYLDHDFVLAHFALANLELTQGRVREAHRHLTNALASLRGHRADETVAETEGLSAGRLVEMITTLLESLPGGASAGRRGDE